MATDKKTGIKRPPKTAAQIRADIAAAQAKLVAAEAKEYGAAIEAALTKMNIVSSINVIKANVHGVTELVILRKIGEMLGIKRLSITQAEVKKRNKKVDR
jgi:hypothetical protein